MSSSIAANAAAFRTVVLAFAANLETQCAPLMAALAALADAEAASPRPNFGGTAGFGGTFGFGGTVGFDGTAGFGGTGGFGGSSAPPPVQAAAGRAAPDARIIVKILKQHSDQQQVQAPASSHNQKK